MSNTIRVKIKQNPAPAFPYSFHEEIAGKEFDAVQLESGVYAVTLRPQQEGQVVWHFLPIEVEVVPEVTPTSIAKKLAIILAWGFLAGVVAGIVLSLLGYPITPETIGQLL